MKYIFFIILVQLLKLRLLLQDLNTIVFKKFLVNINIDRRIELCVLSKDKGEWFYSWYKGIKLHLVDLTW